MIVIVHAFVELEKQIVKLRIRWHPKVSKYIYIYLENVL